MVTFSQIKMFLGDMHRSGRDITDIFMGFSDMGEEWKPIPFEDIPSGVPLYAFKGGYVLATDTTSFLDSSSTGRFYLVMDLNGTLSGLKSPTYNSEE